MIALGIKANGLDQTTAMLHLLPKQADTEKNKAIQKGGQIIAKFWKLRLSGPAGPSRLGVRSGQLRRSIRSRMIDKESAVVGSTMPYSRIHEFGYRGPQHVSAHRVRAHTRGGHAVKAHTRGSFTRTMNMPARPHRAPAERDSAAPLMKIMDGAIDEAIKLARRRGKEIKIAQRMAGGWRRTDTGAHFYAGAGARRGLP